MSNTLDLGKMVLDLATAMNRGRAAELRGTCNGPGNCTKPTVNEVNDLFDRVKARNLRELKKDMEP